MFSHVVLEVDLLGAPLWRPNPALHHRRMHLVIMVQAVISKHHEPKSIVVMM
jgi:hypothetical protein